MSIQSFKAISAFSALISLVSVSGCTAESAADNIEENDDAFSGSGRARSLEQGSYETETLYFGAPTKPATHFNPARPEPLRPQGA